MKKLGVVILVFIFSAPTLFNLGVLVDYGVRYQYYVNVLCENKDKPELHCNGQCHLALPAENNTNDAPSEPLIRIPELQIIAEAMFVESHVSLPETVIHRTPYTEIVSQHKSTPAVKPPEWSEWS